ncbi:MAG: hypothetical protein ACJA1L_002732 [Paracoccaceae bacterium]|jgi:hypothetical protein
MTNTIFRHAQIRRASPGIAGGVPFGRCAAACGFGRSDFPLGRMFRRANAPKQTGMRQSGSKTVWGANGNARGLAICITAGIKARIGGKRSPRRPWRQAFDTCHDNAVTEGLFGLLKSEWIRRSTDPTHREVGRSVSA